MEGFDNILHKNKSIISVHRSSNDLIMNLIKVFIGVIYKYICTILLFYVLVTCLNVNMRRIRNKSR